MRDAAFRRVGRPRGARSGVTRERIVTAASGLFGEFGYHATTFQAVAERAQLTRPAINHYFPSKQLLYQAVLTQAATLFERAVEQARTESTLIGQLSSIIVSFAQLGEEDRTVAAFAVTAVVDAQRDPVLKSLVGDIQGPPRAFLAEALTDAVDRGELVTNSGIGELTEMLLAVWWGVAFYVSLVGNQATSAGVVATLQALLTQELWQLRQPADGKS
ncbi:TetR family transcriptional regulator [Mycolicibacter heraklionensis]|uniref:TetR family transcriptional regulator n=1 Tax=Mycolicibacter heraklionensis TaxID=512402 RepID=A0A9X7WGJ6_9MYCO|nr:TetR/AcrR family transcriptional regulator [Mycolicibacter heraklionensis]KLO27267.1 TetR family transcriptional regulator [Mycolicibacter heraklionensis]QZA07883.1 TetR/AcrR family transcriptional regulator [Mycolicibacter heraklionensis]